MNRLLLASAALIATPALASTDPVKDTRTILAGTVTTKVSKNAYLSGAKDGTTAFQGALSAYKGVRAAEPPLVVKCADGVLIVAPGACPVAPVVIPPPIVTEPVVAPNGIKGAFDIPDNFNVAATLIPTVETVPASLDPNGAFRFTCQAGQIAKDDPIALPGQPGASHAHQFFGNTGTNAFSTYQTLRTTGGSTCTRIVSNGIVTPLDPTPQRTAYWMPAMLDGAGNYVKPDYFLTYYKQLPASSPENGFPDATSHVGIVTPLPNDLKFIYGYNMATGLGGPATTDSSPGSDAWRMGYDCVVPDGTGVSYTGPQHTIADIVATGKCPVGAWLRVAITLPDCWDGVHTDTADHRSHMVPASGAGMFGRRACPADHPYNIPEIAIQAFFTTDANFAAGKWLLSSDAMVPGAVPGSTLHFDYEEAWSPTVKNMWQTGCINGKLSCNVGELGNGQSIKGMTQDLNTIPRHQLVPVADVH
jgi:hypothetical protein